MNGQTELTASVAPASTITAGDLADTDGLAAMITSMDDVAVTDAATAATKFDAASNKEKAAYLESYKEAAVTTPLASPETFVGTDQVKGTSFKFQIGANAGENISVSIADMTKTGLGIDGIDVVAGNTDDILGQIDDAISSVSSQRANLGAVQNRLDHTVSNLATTKENLSEANSRITDVDMAEEMMSFTKSNILSQASTSMLAQANQMPQSVLSLLQ